jgi:hypothetical protein
MTSFWIHFSTNQFFYYLTPEETTVITLHTECLKSPSWWSGGINKVCMYWQICKITSSVMNMDITNSYTGQHTYGIYRQSRWDAEQLPSIRKKHWTSKTWQFHIHSFSLLSRITKWLTETLAFFAELNWKSYKFTLCMSAPRQAICFAKQVTWLEVNYSTHWLVKSSRLYCYKRINEA